jgi:hypothetical protein
VAMIALIWPATRYSKSVTFRSQVLHRSCNTPPLAASRHLGRKLAVSRVDKRILFSVTHTSLFVA